MGRLMVIDGLDGSGKSTQFERLSEYLDSRGTSYQKISFPDYDQPSSALVKLYLSGAFGSDPQRSTPMPLLPFTPWTGMPATASFGRRLMKPGR